MKAFGFPVGPVTLLDEVGVDVAAKIGKVLVRHFGERMALPPAASRMVEDGRLGRKTKKGFYTYDGKKKQVDETVYSLLAERDDAALGRPGSRSRIGWCSPS